MSPHWFSLTSYFLWTWSGDISLRKCCGVVGGWGGGSTWTSNSWIPCICWQVGGGGLLQAFGVLKEWPFSSCHINNHHTSGVKAKAWVQEKNRVIWLLRGCKVYILHRRWGVGVAGSQCTQRFSPIVEGSQCSQWLHTWQVCGLICCVPR